ncbi:glycine betaine ABC transporter substrate-binding protein [Bacillus sp. 03113]|uniref:glycine betaine ABC transporter substrate-binding protein n=1 Tax=Bacillus sp. 03113 TaxID=2578211 RepID=UPI0011437A27|nr:glycine betaine ABC transporter substrate-binding protein [Bacillus sp. 03113]
MKRFFYKFILITVILSLSACGSKSSSNSSNQENNSNSKKEITIGYLAWDEDIAVSYLWKSLLEEKGYKVKLVQADVAPIFSGVAKGSIDLFLDTWMPTTHSTYMEKYKDKVDVLGTWYEEADSGLAVPDYMDIKSIEDLKNYKDELGGKIIGIEPGAGLMRLTRENAIPGYGLESMTLVESSTPAMLAELEKAVSSKKPIVVTLWRPHWAFEEYKLRYLEDPKNAMNPSGAEKLQVIGSKEFETKFPEVAKWMELFKMDLQQIAQLEGEITKSKDEAKGVESWLSKNESVKDAWLK